MLINEGTNNFARIDDPRFPSRFRFLVALGDAAPRPDARLDGSRAEGRGVVQQERRMGSLRCSVLSVPRRYMCLPATTRAIRGAERRGYRSSPYSERPRARRLASRG